jgi:hypothetical protein
MCLPGRQTSLLVVGEAPYIRGEAVVIACLSISARRLWLHLAWHNARSIVEAPNDPEGRRTPRLSLPPRLYELEDAGRQATPPRGARLTAQEGHGGRADALPTS